MSTTTLEKPTKNGQKTQPAIPQARAELIVDAIEQRIGNGMSANKLSKTLGISPAQMSAIRNGDWATVSIDRWNTIAAELKINDWPTLETPNFLAIYDLCREAQENSRLMAIVGNPGMGKTTALRSYAKENPNAYYVHCRGTMRVGDFLREILRVMGINKEGSIDYMVVAISEELNKANEPVLIIDDAGKIIERIIKTLQTIYDNTEFHAGLVIAGVEELHSKLDYLRRKNKSGGPEFWDRIGNTRRLRFLTKPSKVVTRDVCHVMGINDPNAIRWYYNNCPNYRMLRQDIMNAKRVSERTEEAITEALLISLYPTDNG